MKLKILKRKKRFSILSVILNRVKGVFKRKKKQEIADVDSAEEIAIENDPAQENQIIDTGEEPREQDEANETTEETVEETSEDKPKKKKKEQKEKRQGKKQK